MAVIALPLTGTGDATASVAVDTIGGESYQRVKLFSGVLASTQSIDAKATTPGAADGGIITRPIGSTAFNQAVVGSVGLTSGSSEVALTSVGSTRVVGTVNLTSGQQTIGTVDLSSVGSTKTIGAVTINAISTATTMGSVALLAGTSANTVGSVALVAGTSANTLGSVALVAGTSANTIGAVAQAGPATSGVYWFMQSIPFSSANAARTTVNTSVDVSVIAANSARKALVIASLSTSQVVALGMTTAAVTTGLAAASLFLQPMTQVSFGLQGGLPLFLGPFRGINISSTAVAGGVAVTEFT